MKKNQTIILRTLMAVAIMFGVETTASAQFGGLKGLANKAKAAKEKVEQKVNNATNGTQRTVANAVGETPGVSVPGVQTQGDGDNSTDDAIRSLQADYDDQHSGDFDQKSDGSYWIWQSSGFGTRVYGSAKLFGKWYPKERKMVAGNYVFTVDESGKVLDKDGNLKGAVQKNRIVTANAEVLTIKETDSSLHLLVGDKEIGEVTKDGRCIFGTDLYAQAGAIDPRPYAFLIFGLQYSNQELLAMAEKREKAVTETEVELAEHQEIAEFTARVTRMAKRENVEKNGMSGEMDSRDYYKYEQTNYLDHSCHWVWMDNIKVCGWNPETNRLLDRNYDWLGTFSGGVLYDRFGVKYGSVQGGTVKNRHGQVVGRVVKGSFKGTYLGGKDKDFNYKLVDASGKQVGLIQTNASPDLVAAWALCMFAKK